MADLGSNTDLWIKMAWEEGIWYGWKEGREEARMELNKLWEFVESYKGELEEKSVLIVWLRDEN